MKIIHVTYSTKAEYAAQNQSNINQVMTDLQNLGNTGINYNACVCADGKTFIHSAFFKTEEDRMALGELASFKHFQEQLKASGPEVPPKQDVLTLIGTSTPIFKD